jgi:hypothetical protein
MRTRRFAVQTAASALILALAASSAPAAVPDAAPAPRPAPLHDLVFLSPATSEVVEGGAPATITILRTGHGTVRGTVDYSTSDGSAAAGSDYQSKTGTASLQAPDDATEVLVNVTPDSEVEPPETINVALANPAGAPGMILRFPFTGTITIIDDDGPARFSLSTALYSNFENRSSMDITIVRSGDASGTSSVTYATADGTAVGGDDYTAVPPTTVEFAPGERFKRQSIPLINDSDREDPEQFSVSLSDPGGAVLTDPSTAQADVLDDDSGSSDKTPPVTNFHRPLNGKKYKTTSPYAKELHVSPGDEGSGLEKVELALLMKRRNGKCAWYRGSRFRSGGCLTKKWVTIPTRLFIVYRLKEKLKPAAKKTGIKNYTAYARATDKAGNVERLFEAGRNKMTYRIVP